MKTVCLFSIVLFFVCSFLACNSKPTAQPNQASTSNNTEALIDAQIVKFVEDAKTIDSESKTVDSPEKAVSFAKKYLVLIAKEFELKKSIYTYYKQKPDIITKKIQDIEQKVEMEDIGNEAEQIFEDFKDDVSVSQTAEEYEIQKEKFAEELSKLKQ